MCTNDFADQEFIYFVDLLNVIFPTDKLVFTKDLHVNETTINYTLLANMENISADCDFHDNLITLN